MDKATVLVFIGAVFICTLVLMNDKKDVDRNTEEVASYAMPIIGMVPGAHYEPSLPSTDFFYAISRSESMSAVWHRPVAFMDRFKILPP